MHRLSALLAIVALGSFQAVPAAEKAIWHYVSIPIIEGTGVFASVASIVDDRSSTHTMVASGTNLGLIAAQGTLGLITAFSSDERRLKMRKVHRVLGFVITGAALWLGIANSIDGGDAAQQATSYGYAALTSVPLIMFSF